MGELNPVSLEDFFMAPPTAAETLGPGPGRGLCSLTVSSDELSPDWRPLLVASSPLRWLALTFLIGKSDLKDEAIAFWIGGKVSGFVGKRSITGFFFF